MSVKVRIAPSPTGNLHIGTARTALFNWLFARHHGGEFILRIEDTDLERSKKEYEESIVEGLRWLGIDWDNKKIERQTERLALYRDYLQKLLDADKAFERTFTDEEKTAMIAEGRTPRDSIIVLRPPKDTDRKIGFDDKIRGHIEVKTKDVGFVSLAKDLNTPLYNFAVVVDDIEMGITDVIRGEDHISNTPKQLLIYEALSIKPPEFAHLPLILGPDKSKMSKRHGATNIADYQKDYLPEAFVNFMGTLGYTYDKEILPMDEMAQQFDLGHVHKSGAIFDQKKLDWFNSQYLKKMPAGKFLEKVQHPDLPAEAAAIMTERLEKLSDIETFSYLWQDPVIEPSLLVWKDDKPEKTLRALQKLAELSEQGNLSQESLNALSASDFDGQKGSVYWPLRTALSGLKNSAGPLDIAAVIGSTAVQRRISVAIAKLRHA